MRVRERSIQSTRLYRLYFVLTCTSVFGRAMVSQVYGMMKVQESKVRGGAIEIRGGDAFRLIYTFCYHQTLTKR